MAFVIFTRADTGTTVAVNADRVQQAREVIEQPRLNDARTALTLAGGTPMTPHEVVVRGALVDVVAALNSAGQVQVTIENPPLSPEQVQDIVQRMHVLSGGV